jgi:hypothetical protein
MKQHQPQQQRTSSPHAKLSKDNQRTNLVFLLKAISERAGLNQARTLLLAQLAHVQPLHVVGEPHAQRQHLHAARSEVTREQVLAVQAAEEESCRHCGVTQRRAESSNARQPQGIRWRLEGKNTKARTNARGQTWYDRMALELRSNLSAVASPSRTPCANG